jgi:histidine triad (HIT) family protein
VAVLVTREQRGVSHLLVLPTAHRSTLLDIVTGEASDLMIAIRDAAQSITAAKGSSGLAVWQNNGLPAHQAIGHLHFHVAGTLPDGGTDFGDVPELTVDETNAVARDLAPYVPRAARRHIFF